LPRPKTNKLYRTFNKGLITEAGFLTYPENASIDELNTVIKNKGSRSRRFGIDWEPSSNGDNTVAASVDQLDVCTTYCWLNVNGKSSVNYLCVQAEGKIYFYNLDATPIIGTPLPFTIDLTTYVAPAASTAQVKAEPVQMASGKGFLFIVSPYIEPLLVEANTVTPAITVTKIVLLVRDFDGIEDFYSNEDQPSTLTDAHYYNLRNQGWVQPGPIGVVEGTPTAPYTGAPPGGSSSGTGGGGNYIRPGDGGVYPDIP
jgi:hypothetical protein